MAADAPPWRWLGEHLSELVNWRPLPLEAAPVVEVPARVPRPLAGGEAFSVLTWNLQFAATRRSHFWYDGGPDVSVPPADVETGLQGIARVLADEAPDLALLQEVDRDSARTGRVDELARLVEGSSFPTWVSTPYHRCRHVPHPPGRHLGRVDFHLAILSQRALASATRHALPAMHEPWIRQELNLRRAILAAELPLLDGRTLAVAVTHLSAFTGSDGTLPRQVAVLRRWMEVQRAQGRPFVLGGDLNLLPPGDDPARLGREAAEYRDAPPPLASLLGGFRSVIPAAELLQPRHRTYLPPGASAPDRVLDYLFVSDDVEVLDARVVAADPMLSDHLPLRATLRIMAPASAGA